MIDIEESTELLHRLGEDYGAMLSQLRRLLRTALRDHGGREVDATGDELFAAFERPPSAVRAAIAIQRAVGAHPWGDGNQRYGFESGSTPGGQPSVRPATLASRSTPWHE